MYEYVVARKSFWLDIFSNQFKIFQQMKKFWFENFTFVGKLYTCWKISN